MSMIANLIVWILISLSDSHELLWYDNMEVGTAWNVTGNASDEIEHCHLGQCVRIGPHTAIWRQHLLQQTYAEIQVTYSMQVAHLQANELCGIYYSTNHGKVWHLLQQYTHDHNDELYANQTVNIPSLEWKHPYIGIGVRYSSTSPDIDELSNGSCYVDEVYLYGLAKSTESVLENTYNTETEVIWFDNMDSGDGWYFENTSDHAEHCYIGNCVQMSGNAYIERDGLSTKNWKNVQLKYSLKAQLLEAGDRCNVYYSVDKQDLELTRWILIGSYDNKFNEEYQLNEVLDLPLDADDNVNVQIKFNLTSASGSKNSRCYVDEVSLLGVKQNFVDYGDTSELQLVFAILTYNLLF